MLFSSVTDHKVKERLRLSNKQGRIVPEELDGKPLDFLVRALFSPVSGDSEGSPLAVKTTKVVNVAKKPHQARQGKGTAPSASTETMSWGEARKLVERGKVFVDDQQTTDGLRRLRTGQEIHLEHRAPRLDTVQRLPDDAIVFLDNHLVVVFKPAGLSTVPFDGSPGGSLQGKASREWTLEEGVRTLLSDRLPKGQRSVRPSVGVVHRIDKETSGLLVFARTWLGKQSLSSQFRAHTVHRRYMALVHGTPREGEYRSHIVEDRGDGFRGSVECMRNPKRGAQGQLAVTHVAMIERFGNTSLIECRLETGRTHQIRVHLSEAGCPLLGDRVYSKDFRKVANVIPAPRLMLHAKELGFVHPKTELPVQFDSELPQDMHETILRLRSR
jgi:23S rRNA pseudouridine1911/1915/1917 synthase